MKKLLFPILLTLVSITLPSYAKDVNELAKAYPIEFSYSGEKFSPEKWTSETNIPESKISYTSPDKKLRLTVEYRTYEGYPVTEVRPTLECITQEETAMIDDFKSLSLARACSSRNIKIRRITGSQTHATDFSRQDRLLQKRHECDYLSMTSNQGRSTAWLPYFGIDLDATNGMEIAIGWTGTWRVDMHYGNKFTMTTSLLDTPHFKMLPGECFKMPYTVIYERKDKTVEEGLVEFHRFIIDHKSPRDINGKNIEPWLPLTASGGNKTDENILKIIDFGKKYFNDIKFNVFWVDAGWYGEDQELDQKSNCGPLWYKTVGNWKINKWAHPDGNLKKVSDAAHKEGMKFLLWFEPERATSEAPIVIHHPEYFLRTKENPSDQIFLTNLGNDEARKWITNEVVRNIRESQVDIYRQDFNCDPLPIWRDADSPDRQCVTEIKYINGLYAFWDELHRLFPSLWFENCAGGGTRMDIEMMSRAYSYCRDDFHMWKNPEETTQNITLNTTAYLPITGGETFAIKPYDTYGFLSCMGAGTVFTPNDFQGMVLDRTPEAKEIAWFHSMLKVAERTKDLFWGDFYALTNNLDGSDIYCGYQLNDTKRGEGFYMVFRREACPDNTFYLRLRNIDSNATYQVEEFEGKITKMKGEKLAQKILTFASSRSYKLVFYKKI